MEYRLKDINDTKNLAKTVSAHLSAGDVVALYGDLGTGKTTFTKLLAEELGFTARVQSPTFVVARRYTKDNGDIQFINHLDLYRMTTTEDIQELGLEELFTEPKAVTLIEWPELAESQLPQEHISIKFEIFGDERKADVQNLH